MDDKLANLSRDGLNLIFCFGLHMEPQNIFSATCSEKSLLPFVLFNDLFNCILQSGWLQDFVLDIIDFQLFFGLYSDLGSQAFEIMIKS